MWKHLASSRNKHTTFKSEKWQAQFRRANPATEQDKSLKRKEKKKDAFWDQKCTLDILIRPELYSAKPFEETLRPKFKSNAEIWWYNLGNVKVSPKMITIRNFLNFFKIVRFMPVWFLSKPFKVKSEVLSCTPENRDYTQTAQSEKAISFISGSLD